MPDHSPSTDERASLALPSQSSSPLECTSHLGFSLVLHLLLGLGFGVLWGLVRCGWSWGCSIMQAGASRLDTVALALARRVPRWPAKGLPTSHQYPTTNGETIMFEMIFLVTHWLGMLLPLVGLLKGATKMLKLARANAGESSSVWMWLSEHPKIAVRAISRPFRAWGGVLKGREPRATPASEGKTWVLD